jgi:hypothetical protein
MPSASACTASRRPSSSRPSGILLSDVGELLRAECPVPQRDGTAGAHGALEGGNASLRVDANAFPCRCTHEYFPAAIKTHHRRGQDLAERIGNQRRDAIAPYRNKAVRRTEVNSDNHRGATLSRTGRIVRRQAPPVSRRAIAAKRQARIRDAALYDAEQECGDDRPHPQQDSQISQRGLVGSEAALYLLAALHCLGVATEQMLGQQRVPEQKTE